MPDYKRNQAEPPGRTLAEAAEMCRRWTRVLDGLVVDRARAADEVAADYSTTTEPRRHRSSARPTFRSGSATTSRPSW